MRKRKPLTRAFTETNFRPAGARGRIPAVLRKLAALATLSLLACGDTVATARPRGDVVSTPEVVRPAGSAQPVTVIAPQAVLKPQTVGALERPQALRRFWDALSALEAGQLAGDVRVVQYGDSHTAADIETAAIRRALQARFGDGGRGFVALGQPWKHYVQESVRTGMSREWAAERGTYVQGKFVGDGLYGLGGAAVFSGKKGGRAWADCSAPASRLEIAYLEQPNGGSFEVYIDGARRAKVQSRGERVVSSFQTFDVPEGPHNVELRPLGDGDVRVFGVALDRSNSGVVYDALGINGARASGLLHLSEVHMAEQLRHRAPHLVILAYGTNETGDDTSPQTYERQLVDVLGRLSRAVPESACLLLGPPDRAIETKDGWVTSPRVFEVAAVQRRVAEAAGCAYYSQFDAMGGEGSIANWALEEPARAQKDRVHLSREGYVQLGGSVASDLMRAYMIYRVAPGAGAGAGAGAGPGLLPVVPAGSASGPQLMPKVGAP